MSNANENQSIPPEANPPINSIGAVNSNVSNLPTQENSDHPLNQNGSSTPSGLKKMLQQIYYEENMDDVVIILDRVKNARKRYEESKWLYRILSPGPFLLVRQIKKLLKSNTVTSELVKTLDPDELALLLFNVLYGVWVLFGLVILISLSLKVSSLEWWIVNIFVFLGLLAIRVRWYDKIIEDTRCVKLYDDFEKAINAQEEEERKFIQNICGLYNKLRNTENESKVNRVLDRLKIQDKEEYRRLELESQENLQALEASVAYAQASNEQNRKKLINETELEYMASKYKITGEGIHAQAHEITLAMIRSEETVLKSLSEALVGDEKANRDMLRYIQQEQAILGALKGDLGKHGRGAYAKPDFNEKLQDLMKTRAKRYGSTEP